MTATPAALRRRGSSSGSSSRWGVPAAKQELLQLPRPGLRGGRRPAPAPPMPRARAPNPAGAWAARTGFSATRPFDLGQEQGRAHPGQHQLTSTGHYCLPVEDGARPAERFPHVAHAKFLAPLLSQGDAGAEGGRERLIDTCPERTTTIPGNGLPASNIRSPSR